MIPKSDLRNNHHSEYRQKKNLTDQWLQHRLKKAYEVREERDVTETRDVPRPDLLGVCVGEFIKLYLELDLH